VPYAHDAGDPPPTLVPMLEFSLRQALILYKGDWTVFFSKPIALVFLVLTVAFLWRFAWKPAKFMGK
jgi:TctA family transporter